jgi:Ca2+-binding EF-hand superfamily protein
MSEDELEKYKFQLSMVFRLFDSNKDGSINRDELSSALRSIGKKVTNAKMNKIFERADKDKTGSITVQNFVDYMIEKQKLKTVSHLFVT